MRIQPIERSVSRRSSASATNHELIGNCSNLAMVLATQAPLDPYPHLRCGVRVEVRSGPMRGVQGLIQDRSRRDRLILQVDMLGQAVSLEVDAAMLDVID